MRRLDGVTIIEIVWDGPIAFDRVGELRSGEDYGVYQVYGTHAVLGPDSLLYIGMAERRTFGERIPEHIEWTQWQSSLTNVYLGRLAGCETIARDRYDEWGKMINRAEDILLYFCTPPYNARQISNLRTHPATVLLNYRRHHRIPAVISNLSELSFAEKLTPFRATYDSPA
jgi:hypothetical protein